MRAYAVRLLRLCRIEFSVHTGVGLQLEHARKVNVLRDFVEAELLVVIRSDPLGGVDRAFLECRMDVTGRDLLRDHAELRQHLPAETRDAHFDAVEIGW